MKIELNSCFPEDSSGNRGPLPKQLEFMRLALSTNGPKYILYAGGVGSGKTLIGCITVLAWALMHPGDYLISRQFSPELADTTLRTFKDICPKELLHEERIADRIVKIKSQGGKLSTILFRQLEEPDKLRSLNLSGFYIDESSQVSEAAFLLLQSRLRGNGLRKGILTTNPNGHDWQYTWFVKKDGLKEEVKDKFKCIQASSKENTHLPEDYVPMMMATWSPERIQRDIEGSFDAFEGMVYHEFRRDKHVVQPFVIPKEWTRIIGIDHGYRNPSCWLWGAVDYDDNVYIYREFYEREWLIEEICKGNPKVNKPGVIQLMKNESIMTAVIDPSTMAERKGPGTSDYQTYYEHLPSKFPLALANNDVTAGIDRVKTFLKIQPTTNQPKLFIFSTCTNLIDELSRYRYPELTHGQQGRVNEKEKPQKVDDHAVDALRYLIMTRPEGPDEKLSVWKRIKYNSGEGRLYRELQGIKKPKTGKDPFEMG